MADDSEPANPTETQKTDAVTKSTAKKADPSQDSDLLTATTSLFKKINYKLWAFVFLIGMVIFSIIFEEKILSRFTDTKSADTPTTRGTIIQLLFLCMFGIIIQLLIEHGIL